MIILLEIAASPRNKVVRRKNEWSYGYNAGGRCAGLIVSPGRGLLLGFAAQYLVHAARAKSLKVQGYVGVADGTKMLSDARPYFFVQEGREVGWGHLDTSD